MTSTTASSIPASRPEQPAAYSSPGLDLGGAFKIFRDQLNSRMIATALAVAVVVRIALGGWQAGDVIAAAIILALEPFTEWVIHVTVLHLKPVTIRGRTFDPIVARKHRAHHRDPKIIRLVLIPRGVLVRLLLFAFPFYWLLAPTAREALTAVVTGYAMLLAYEWTHFLIHSSYVPKTWYYRYVWRAHRLHHYKNEKYWFGVTVHFADHLLKTFPERDAVETSPTARTLGVDAA
jgi:hypothetical protein